MNSTPFGRTSGCLGPRASMPASIRSCIWRERRKLTLSALARSSGVRMSYLSEIEAGEKPGSVDAYRKAAAALGVDIDDLVPAAKRR